MTERTLDQQRAQEAIDAIIAFKDQSRFARIMIAVAVLGGALALVLLVTLLNREQTHARREREKDAQLALKTSQLQAALAQIQQLSGASPQLTVAIKKAAQIGSALGDDTVTPADLTPQKPQPAPSTAPAPASSSGATAITVATGLASGWDVDVFWCTGSASASDYATASAAATALASAATNHQQIASGIRLGVIRLRPVPDAKFTTWIRGTRVIADPGVGDVDTANAIIAYLAGSPAGQFTLAHSKGRPTPYYVSVSACNSSN